MKSEKVDITIHEKLIKTYKNFDDTLTTYSIPILINFGRRWGGGGGVWRSTLGTKDTSRDILAILRELKEFSMVRNCRKTAACRRAGQ